MTIQPVAKHQSLATTIITAATPYIDTLLQTPPKIATQHTTNFATISPPNNPNDQPLLLWLFNELQKEHDIYNELLHDIGIILKDTTYYLIHIRQFYSPTHSEYSEIDISIITTINPN